MKALTDSKLAYVAGLVDGEGAIFIGKYRRAGNKHLAYRGYFGITNTHIPMLLEVKEWIGGRISTQGLEHKCYVLSFSANEIRNVLPEVLSFLIIKKDQAELLLSFLEKQASNGSAPISDGLLKFYEDCYQEMKRLHHLKFDYKEPRKFLGNRKCEQCSNEFPVYSDRSNRKIYCSNYCKRKTHWTRSNLRIREGRPAWEGAAN